MNGIAPGPIKDTPGTAKLAPGFTKDDVEEMIAERIPMARTEVLLRNALSRMKNDQTHLRFDTGTTWYRL